MNFKNEHINATKILTRFALQKIIRVTEFIETYIDQFIYDIVESFAINKNYLTPAECALKIYMIFENHIQLSHLESIKHKLGNYTIHFNINAYLINDLVITF